MKIEDIQRATLAWLEANQEKDDGEECVRGEFPMTLSCPEAQTDYNFLTGYALFHLAVCETLLINRLSADALRTINTILKRASDVLVAYQTTRGSTNWYHGRLSGDHLPPNFNWPQNRRLSVCDDLDDTAISAILNSLRPSFIMRRTLAPRIFTDWLYDPERDKLRTKALRRLKLSGVPAKVYMTWVIEPGGGESNETMQDSLKVPQENSVELVTAANILTAIKRICDAPGSTYGPPDELAGFAETQRFVNQLTSLALDKLLVEDDPAFLEFCAPYYPRVPFAPLAFLLRAHALSNHSLLWNETLEKIATAVRLVDPARYARALPYADYAARAHWLNAAGWCDWIGLLPRSWLAERAIHELEGLVRNDFNLATGSWPDFIFFLAAHIGDYGGVAYSNCMMVETMSLLVAAQK